MPGLSQLKKFNSDILSLGNEAALRAQRRERNVTVPIPKNIKDEDDSSDFVMGLPEREESFQPAEKTAPVDEDLSDITGISSAPASAPEAVSTEADAAPSIDVSDLSSLLNPIETGSDGGAAGDIPDLSMFMDNAGEDSSAPEQEIEEEEPSIADLSLDDLLNSEGFDGGVLPDAESSEESADEENISAASPAGNNDIPEAELLPPEDAVPLDEPIPLDEALPEDLAAEKEFDAPETADDFEEPAAAEIIPEFDGEFKEPAVSDTADEFAADAALFGDDLSSDISEIDMNEGLPENIEEDSLDFMSGAEQQPETGTVTEKDADSGFAAPEKSQDTAASDFDLPDFEMSDFFGADKEDKEIDDSGNPPAGLFNAADIDSSTRENEEVTADSASNEFSSDFDFNIGGDGAAGGAADGGDLNSEEASSYNGIDTSQMEGLDFSIPETDSQLAAGEEKTDFELGTSDEFGIDDGDFEIPGFSDVETVTDIRKPKPSALAAGSSDEEQGGKLPKNTLSDEQFKEFLKNLSEYPLNVRIAAEELIVKDEFTDDAEFEIIRKILKKVPARQLASELEKMLDISIHVPRDYERRTAEEYEAFKKSFQYQLQNRIIPGTILSVITAALCFFIFLFARDFIYKPIKASGLYKQGYQLLQADEYPQSEMKFNEAVKYDLQKRWFYKYAEGYRAHKQYERAAQMFRNILNCFKFDKPAGLQYAEMELYDLANYERAENIILRDILDHHINDPDGILLLGDTYLEWATEKDPEKFENARIRYSDLIQLYGQTNLYLSRMMRYFIRTDNLLEVLQLKERFMPREKSLSAQDWTELSGYLFDKLYGPLAPSDEYLRTSIDDVKEMLVRAVKAGPENPIALYNLSRYYVQMKNSYNAKSTLEQTITAFKEMPVRRRRDIYKEIDSYRLLGEQYVKENEFLKAQESYTDGITLYTTEHNFSGLDGNSQVGKLYADMGDLDYFISGDLDSALENYKDSVEYDNDTPAIRYRIGYIQYNKKNYSEALGSFMKTGEEESSDPSLLLAMGNTLSIRNDNFAAQGYYERLVNLINAEKAQKGYLFPQSRAEDAEAVDMYLKASNNLGVVFYRLARRTGSSSMNAQAMVCFQESMRAWDSMTRNQETLVRLGGSNLAEQNMQYISHPAPLFEPAIYTDLPRTLSGDEGLHE